MALLWGGGGGSSHQNEKMVCNRSCIIRGKGGLAPQCVNPWYITLLNQFSFWEREHKTRCQSNLSVLYINMDNGLAAAHYDFHRLEWAWWSQGAKRRHSFVLCFCKIKMWITYTSTTWHIWVAVFDSFVLVLLARYWKDECLLFPYAKKPW